MNEQRLGVHFLFVFVKPTSAYVGYDYVIYKLCFRITNLKHFFHLPHTKIKGNIKILDDVWIYMGLLHCCAVCGWYRCVTCN